MFGLKIIRKEVLEAERKLSDGRAKTVKELYDENERLKKALFGETTCGDFCAYCQHGLWVDNIFTLNRNLEPLIEKRRGYICARVIPCKQFEMRAAECKQEEA